MTRSSSGEPESASRSKSLRVRLQTFPTNWRNIVSDRSNAGSGSFTLARIVDVKIFLSPPSDLQGLPEPLSFRSSVVHGAIRSAYSVSAATRDLSPGELDKLVFSHGPEVSFERFGRLTLLISSPHLVDEVLIEKASFFLKGDEERALAAVVGWGLLVQEGQHHKAAQRALNPGMRGPILDEYLKRVQATFSFFADDLSFNSAKLVEFCREASQSVAETSIFGLHEPTGDFSYHNAVLSTNRFAMSDVSPGRSSRTEVLDFVAAKDLIHSHVARLMEAWRARKGEPLVLMDYISSSIDPADDWQSKAFDQAGLFLQAATETTASLMAWCFLHLSSREDLWKLLFDEAEELGEGPISHDQLKSLNVHQAVINETLRMAPPVWMLPRVAQTDVQIGELLIPRGTRIVLSPWVTQRSEKSFSNPRVFEPRRWLGGGPRPPAGSFFPFGLGGRVCIGESYGRMTATQMLFHFAKKKLTVSVTPEDTASDISHLLRVPRSDLSLAVA